MNDEAELIGAGSAASSPSLSASSPYSAAAHHSSRWTSNDAAGQRSSFSPSLSSSSHTPSTGNLDEMSDISSLDGDDFELVDAPPVAATTANIIDSAQWEDALLVGDRRSSHSHSSHTNSASSSGSQAEADAAPTATHMRDSWAEAEALNSSLCSTYDLHRVSASSLKATSELSAATPTAESAIVTRSTPRQSSLLPAAGSSSTSASRTSPQQASLDAGNDSVQSLFQFPDPMGNSCSASEAVTSVAASNFSLLDNSAGALRNPWQMAPSSRGAPSTPPNATVATLVSNATPASPERVAVSTLAGTSSTPAPGEASSAWLGNATQLVDLARNDAPAPAAPKLPASLNVFYLGRKPAKDILWRVSLAIRTSLLASLAAQSGTAEPSFGQPKHVDVAEGVQVTWRRASVTKTTCIDLREFSCTTSPDAAAATPWLRAQGATVVDRGGALIVCFLEHGESPQTLGADLAYLLSKHQKRGDASDFKPLLLPILCPHQQQPDEGLAASTDCPPSPSILRAVAHQMDLRNIEREWRSVLVEARFTLDLISGTKSQQLAVNLPPANRIHTVFTYQQLFLGAAPSWFAGDEAWAMQAARPATKGMLGAPLLDIAPVPSWASKTTDWLENNGAEAAAQEEQINKQPVVVVSTSSTDAASALRATVRQRTHARRTSDVTRPRPHPAVGNTPNALRLLAGVPGIGALLVALVAVVCFMTSHSSRVVLAPSPCTTAAASSPLMHKLRASLPLLPPTRPDPAPACAQHSNVSARPSRKPSTSAAESKAIMAALNKDLSVFAPPSQFRRRRMVDEASSQHVIEVPPPVVQDAFDSVLPHLKQGYAWARQGFEWSVGQVQMLWSEIVAMLDVFYRETLPFLKGTLKDGAKAAYQEASAHARQANGLLKHASLQADYLFQHGMPLFRASVRNGYTAAREEAETKARQTNGAFKQASAEAKAAARSLTQRLAELQLEAQIKERARQAVELTQEASKTLRKSVDEVKAQLPRMAQDGTAAAAQLQRDARAFTDETREQLTRSAQTLRETFDDAVEGARISQDKIKLVVEEVRAKTKQRHAQRKSHAGKHNDEQKKKKSSTYRQKKNTHRAAKQHKKSAKANKKAAKRKTRA